MLRFAWLAVVAGSLLAVAAKAQTLPSAPQGFGFCTVTDSSSAQARIWASPVFPLVHAASDPAGLQRSQELAGEFLAHVRTLGGSGTKGCVVVPTQREAAEFRQQQRALWDERMYFIKVGDWREVAWAPAAWSPATAAAPPAQSIRYFYCYNVDTDVPDDRSHTVATGVFARTVRGGNPAAAHELAAAFTQQFQQQVRARGLPEQGDCVPFDTEAEADYQRQQIRKHFKGFNMAFDEIAWTPGESGSEVVSAAAPDTPAGTLVQATSHAIEPPARTPAQAAAALPPGTAATTSVSANASGHGQYCTAFVTRTQEALTLRAPVQPFPFMQDDRAAMRDALSALVAAVIQANPVKWTAFPPVTCYDNSGVHAGETMCVSVGARHFGGTQMAAQFCNGSKEMIDKRWADMVQADGDGARNVAWP